MVRQLEEQADAGDELTVELEGELPTGDGDRFGDFEQYLQERDGVSLGSPPRRAVRRAPRR